MGWIGLGADQLSGAEQLNAMKALLVV